MNGNNGSGFVIVRVTAAQDKAAAKIVLFRRFDVRVFSGARVPSGLLHFFSSKFLLF